jgi:hypothetical protein
MRVIFLTPTAMNSSGASSGFERQTDRGVIVGRFPPRVFLLYRTPSEYAAIYDYLTGL